VNARHRPLTGSVRKSVSAAILLVMLGLAWLAAPPASAQLGSLVVTMTSPGSGSTVSNTIPVDANVSVVGSLTVAAVQLNLDVANLGGEDKSAPN